MEIDERVRELVEEGRLVWPIGPRVEAARGDGSSCVICSDAITGASTQFTFIGPNTRRTLHRDCLAAWVQHLEQRG